jgi:prolyl-tRNA editing enzyme YbaK/EbsC (Cys-tRNA(Pro) deacylase)
VPGARVAKSVVLEDGDKYLMAVVPATDHVDLGALHRVDLVVRSGWQQKRK